MQDTACQTFETLKPGFIVMAHVANVHVTVPCLMLFFIHSLEQSTTDKGTQMSSFIVLGINQ